MITFLYSTVWIVVFILSMIPISNIILLPNTSLILLVFLSSIFFLMIEIITFKTTNIIFKDATDNKIIDKILMFLGILILINGIYSGFKFPILKYFNFPFLEYNEYGLKGLQGLVNALYLACMTIIYFRKVYFSETKYNIVFYILLLYPIVLLSRQVLLSLTIQLFFIWLLHSKKRIMQKITTLLMTIVVTTFLFGTLGDIRVDNKKYSARDLLIDTLEPTDLGNRLPNSILWMYLYITSPTSTLIYNFETAHPNGEIYNYIKPLLPSPLRRSILSDKAGFKGYKNIHLIKHNLNMATAYIAPYLSLGYFGLLLHVLILGFFLFIVKLTYRINQYFYLNYFLAIQVFILTIFTNTLFYLPIIFQFFIFVLLGLIQMNYDRKQNHQNNNHIYKVSK